MDMMFLDCLQYSCYLAEAGMGYLKILHIWHYIKNSSVKKRRMQPISIHVSDKLLLFLIDFQLNKNWARDVQFKLNVLQTKYG